MRVGIVGGGISGIAQAHVFRKNGFDAVVFERASEVGGVWARSYPGISLQNIDFQYHLSDLPWASAPDLHPTGAQIRAYWKGAVDRLGLDVRLEHVVVSAEERDGGWVVTTDHRGERAEHRVDTLVVAVGQYTEGKHRPSFPGESAFTGQIVTEREVRTLEGFGSERVVVVGFGKSALDMATMASEQGARVHHVFRSPRWTLPMQLLGLHTSWLLFNRFGSVMMPGWAHPTAIERFLHRRLRWAVAGFWAALGAVVRWHGLREGRGAGDEARRRLEAVLPTHPLLPDLRSATALAPVGYLRRVAEGRIEPHHAGLDGFESDGVRLTDGTRIPCDRVVLSLGSESPRFPFLPEKYRTYLESEPDGPQLYRHLIHPRIPNVGFGGFNHGFMHVPAAEIGAEWLCCLLRGELELPPVAEMEASIARVQAWKRAHIVFEPSRSCAVNTRYQQYLDILLRDLGVSPYRKWPNVFAEVFARYGASDYAGIGLEIPKGTVHRPLPLDT